MTNWHDDDTFWRLVAPFLFPEQSWEEMPVIVDLISELAHMDPDMAVLDLGCGPGRYSLELARRGYHVTGVDRTRLYLRQARKSAGEEELDVEFVEADMRSFRRPASFDVALSLFTSFGYFEDAAENQLVLHNIYDSLRDGGVLLIELMGKEILARIFQARDWSEQDGAFLLQEREISRNWSWMQNRWIIINDKQRQEFATSHWIYSAVELELMLREAGFARVDIYGDREGRPYDQTASRLMALARK